MPQYILYWASQQLLHFFICFSRFGCYHCLLKKMHYFMWIGGSYTPIENGIYSARTRIHFLICESLGGDSGKSKKLATTSHRGSTSSSLFHHLKSWKRKRLSSASCEQIVLNSIGIYPSLKYLI